MCILVYPIIKIWRPKLNQAQDVCVNCISTSFPSFGLHKYTVDADIYMFIVHERIFKRSTHTHTPHQHLWPFLSHCSSLLPLNFGLLWNIFCFLGNTHSLSCLLLRLVDYYSITSTVILNCITFGQIWKEDNSVYVCFLHHSLFVAAVGWLKLVSLSQ